MIDGIGIPHGIREIRTQNDSIGADFSNQMPQTLGSIDDGIEIELLEIFTGSFLDGSAIAGICLHTMVGTANVGCQIAASMCRGRF